MKAMEVQEKVRAFPLKTLAKRVDKVSEIRLYECRRVGMLLEEKSEELKE